MFDVIYFFFFNLIVSGVMVVSALNTVHSVLWLIVAFINAVVLFILLEVDYIALIFLIVYVGAIAILFLFVIMMLNLIDFEEGSLDMSNYMPAGFIIGVVVFFEVLIFSSWRSRDFTLIPNPNSNLISPPDLPDSKVPLAFGGGKLAGGGIESGNYFRWDFFEKISNIEVLGRILYTNYFYLFILASFLLLVAMIGAIVLTYGIRAEIKRQDAFNQISR